MPGSWEESKHPRAGDGKFGEGGGDRSSAAARLAEAGAKRAAKPKLEPHHEARIERVRSDAADTAAATHLHGGGHGGALTHFGAKIPEDAIRQANEHGLLHGADAAKSERADIERELHHEAAGHLNEIPHRDLDAYHAKATEAADVLDEVRSKLHDQTTKAAGELAAFSQVSADGHPDFETDVGHDTLSDAWTQADTLHSAASQLRGGQEVDGHSYHEIKPTIDLSSHWRDFPEEPQKPDPPIRPETDDPGAMESYKDELVEYADAKKAFKSDAEAYNEAHAARAKVHLEQANKTQAALEELHATQIAAIDKAKAVLRPLDKARDKALSEMEKISAVADDVDSTDEPTMVNKKAFEHHERVDDEDDDLHGQIADPKIRAEYESAAKAGETKHGFESGRREDLPTASVDDHIDPLKYAARETAAAIRELAKITKRNPVIAKAASKSGKAPKVRQAATDDEDDDEE